MYYYCALANDAAQKSLLRWPSRPKHHVSCLTLTEASEICVYSLGPCIWLDLCMKSCYCLRASWN